MRDSPSIATPEPATRPTNPWRAPPYSSCPAPSATSASSRHRSPPSPPYADCRVGDVASADTLSECAGHLLASAPPRFSLCGLSWGGILALEILRQQPERVLRLALLNCSARPASEETRARQQRFVGMSALGEFRQITTDFLKDAMLHPDHRQDLALRRTVLAMAESVGRARFLNQVKAQLARPDARPALGQIRCPTLVIGAREDHVCTVAMHEEIAAAIPGAELIILERCGHLSTLEQPARVNEALLRWLQTDPTETKGTPT